MCLAGYDHHSIPISSNALGLCSGSGLGQRHVSPLQHRGRPARRY
jgi:hypothetical protein